MKNRDQEFKIGLPTKDFTRYRDYNVETHVLDQSDEEDYEPLASKYEDSDVL